MKPLKTVLAAVLTYSLTITPAFGQNEGSSTEDRDAASEADRNEPAATTPPLETGGDVRESDAATDKPSEEATDAANNPELPKKKRKMVQDEPGAPSRGTGKLVAGIITASVGTGLGVLLLAIANIDCNNINKDDANSSDVGKQKERETDVKDCKDQQPQAKVSGSVLLAAGLGVGLPLIYFGVQDRKAYNEWKAGQPSQDDSAYAPGKASLVFLPNGSSFSPGVNVSYNF